MISSASVTYTTQNTRLEEMTAKFILMDSLLAQYGPEATQARMSLRPTASVTGTSKRRAKLRGGAEARVAHALGSRGVRVVDDDGLLRGEAREEDDVLAVARLQQVGFSGEGVEACAHGRAHLLPGRRLHQ